MSCLPSAVIAGGILVLHFSESSPSRSADVTCTLDLTDFGDVVGIEVLDWQRQSGGVVDGPSACGNVRWSYDYEIDALYIHVMSGRSQIQRAVTARAGLDTDGHVVRLDIPIPPRA